MTRVDAYLLLKRQLRDPQRRAEARATEAVMAALAAARDATVETWATMGLLLYLDAEYAAHNPAARGRVAREHAECEGLAPELCASLERCWQLEGEHDELELALPLACWLAEHRRASDLAAALELCRGQGDDEGERVDRALERLALSSADAAAVARAALEQLEARP